MATRTLSAFDVKLNWNAAWGASGKLVITLSRTVVSEDGVSYPATSNVGKPLTALGFHWEAAITVSGGTGTTAALPGLINTDTATPDHVATYDVFIYDARGKMREKLNAKPYHIHESLNSNGASFTWEQWVAAMEFVQFRGDMVFIGDRATIESLIAASANIKAGISPSYGTTSLSVASVSASNPIAVGDNDPRVLPLSPSPALSYGALQGVVDQYGRVTSASALQVPIVQLDSTNLMAGGLVVGGDWGFYVEADGYATHSPVVISGDQAAPAYGFNTVLLARQTLADAAQIRYGHPVTVDSAKRHRFGARASTGNGTDQIQLLVTPLDIAGTLLAVSQNFVPPAAGAITGTTGENSFWLNQIGGGAPAFPTGTLAVLPLIAHATAGAGYAVVYDAYLIPDDRLPTTNYTATSIGWGTHEGASSGTDLYVVSHSFATVSRFSTGMVRQAIATTDAYPHDVIVAGGFVWVINYTGATLQRFDLTTLSNAVTYPLLGGFNGFGLAYDGSRYLYLGIGDSPNSRIIKFDTTTAVAGTTTGQTLLSTDVNGGAANIPVQYLAGSVWANHYTNGTVKRINPSSGATIATISTSIGGGLYGLGTDGTYIYANGNWGIVKIDPATNTVVATYRFSKGYSGSANLKYDGKGRMWGVAGGGPTLFYLDIRAGVLVETFVPPGGAKWVQPVSGYGVYAGFYSSPYLNRYAP